MTEQANSEVRKPETSTTNQMVSSSVETKPIAENNLDRLLERYYSGEVNVDDVLAFIKQNTKIRL